MLVQGPVRARHVHSRLDGDLWSRSPAAWYFTDDLSCPIKHARRRRRPHHRRPGRALRDRLEVRPYAAVRNPGHDGVTIRDGLRMDPSVSSSSTAQRNRILGLAVFGQMDSIALHDSTRTSYGNESFVGSGHGILLRRARGNTRQKRDGTGER